MPEIMQDSGERTADVGASTDTADRMDRTDRADRADRLARQQAIRQLERKRRYWVSTTISTVGMLLLATIWAVTEYHNAGGWPTAGFSQSSGIHDVWNIWIIYPAIAWAFLSTAFGLDVYLRRPVSERKIQREIDRLAR